MLFGIMRKSAILFISLIIFMVNCREKKMEPPKPKYVDCNTLKPVSGMKCIPGGFLIRGSELTVTKLDTFKKIKDESPQSKIELSTFLIDTYEVTYGEYVECMNSGGCSKSTPHYNWVKRHPTYPMLGQTWFQAREFCRWKGKRLPTESEWEKAARGEKGDKYPWGNTEPTCKEAIVNYKGKKGCGTGITHQVGSRPAYRYGLYDMAGNAHEWVNDWYSESYTRCGEACFGKDPKGPCDGADNCPGYKERVVKGGSWYWPPDKARSSWRRPHDPHQKTRYHHFGFRCARDIQNTDYIKQ